MPEILEPSVKSLFLRIKSNDHEISTGTGFIVTSATGHMLITNRHIVTGRNNDTDELLSIKTGAVPDEIIISHNSKKGLGTWVEHCEPLYNNHKPLWHEYPTLGSQADFVALPITQTEDVEFRSYDIY